jgi:hypothetical protein
MSCANAMPNVTTTMAPAKPTAVSGGSHAVGQRWLTAISPKCHGAH